MELKRRAFMVLIGRAAAVGGGMVVLAACGQPAPPTATPAPAPQPAQPAPKPAEPTASPKPAAPAAPAAATPTPVAMITPVPQPADAAKVVLSNHYPAGWANDFQVLLNDYNATQGPKDKTYATQRRWTSVQAYMADFQAGTQEDMYLLNDAYLADLASRGFFSPPPKEIVDSIKQSYLPKPVLTGIWQGQLMGYPAFNEPHMMFLHKQLFKNAGLDAEKDQPKTFDDVRQLAKQLTKREGAQKVQAGFIVHNNAGERIVVQRMLYQFLEGAPLVDESVTPPKFDVTSDGARKFTQLLYNLTTDDSTSADMGAPNTLWPQGKGAMITHDSWTIGLLLVKEGVPGIVEQMHTIPLRSSDGKRTGNFSRNYHILVSSKSKYKDQCWAFLRWLGDGPAFRHENMYVHIWGLYPAVKDFPLPKFYPEQMKKAFTDSVNEPLQTALPIIKGLGEVYNILRDNHDGLVLKKMTPDEATKRMDEELKAAMQKAYSS